jgi:hypothetical protein
MAKKLKIEFEQSPTDDEPREAFRRARERVAQVVSSPSAAMMLREMREYAEKQKRLRTESKKQDK